MRKFNWERRRSAIELAWKIHAIMNDRSLNRPGKIARLDTAKFDALADLDAIAEDVSDAMRSAQALRIISQVHRAKRKLASEQRPGASKRLSEGLATLRLVSSSEWAR